ncbi:MAG: nitroreductase family protein [Lachnospiraceae bacterium]|nr:nitroreductase family protein [Lachnospiraceae bacterium]
MFIKKVIQKIINENLKNEPINAYRKRFLKYSFTTENCHDFEQYEALITKLYHTIEKGLSYMNYRPAFGEKNVSMLISTLSDFSDRYGTSHFCYQTALDCLYKYVEKNNEYGHYDEQLETRIRKIPGERGNCGGTLTIESPGKNKDMYFDKLMLSRHSIRHFSMEDPVDLTELISAIELAQYTPSACNRQCWKTRIVANNTKVKEILQNQNGNRGFGDEIDKLLVITADLRMQQKSREFFQAFIDGGMYAQNILNSLFFYGIGSVPLSASLTPDQEKAVRQTIGMNDAEILILFIGVGNYPRGSVTTTRSERRHPVIEVL